MKRRITLSIALALSIVLISLTIPDRAANAQNNMRSVLDTGVMAIGSGQALSASVATGDVTGDGSNIRVRFRKIKYSACNASPKLCIESQEVSQIMTLAPHEAADITADGPGNWRIVVESNKPNVRVNGIVFDTSVYRVVALCCTSQTMYWP